MSFLQFSSNTCVAGAIGFGMLASIARADTIMVPAHQPTIQAAIDVAVDGDEVVVLPGVYNELIDFKGKAITVRSVSPKNPEVVAATVLDGTGLIGGIVRFISGETPDSVLSGLTIQNGTGEPLYPGGEPGQAECNPGGNGTSCANAKPIDEGLTTAPSNTTTWFCYTSDCSGPALLRITLCAVPVTPAVYDACDGEIVPVDTSKDCFNGDGFETTYRIVGGSSYIIQVDIPDHPTSHVFLRFNCYDQRAGGAVYIDGSAPTIDDSVIASNSAYYGAGVHVESGALNLVNCTLEGNLGSFGAGINNEEGAIVAQGCAFQDNDAAVTGFVFNAGFGAGGAIRNGGESTFVDCAFVRNSAQFSGGAITSHNSLNVSDCMFEGNATTNHNPWGGSAISSGGPGTLAIANTSFHANQGDVVILDYSASATLSGCVFDSNIGPEFNSDTITVDQCSFVRNGSVGMFVSSKASTSITNSTFVGNQFAGLWGVGDDIVVSNCVFRANGSSKNSIGIGAIVNGSPQFVNCTFANNLATELGGGILNAGGTPTIVNSIFNGNSPHQIDDFTDGISVVEYSNVEGGWPGIGNIDVDPMFADDNLRLAAGSPCIDAGDNAAVPAGILTDMAGNPRFADDPDTIDTGSGAAPIVDMGAYEYGSGCPADVFPPNGGNGIVNVADLLFVVQNFGTPDGDVDGDGDTDVHDLLAVIGAWGVCP